MQEWRPTREGYVGHEGFKVWYGADGGDDSPGALPVLAVHGGPGMPHDALEPLARLGAGTRRVVFYDQLGCGNSDRPADPGVYSHDLFIREIGAVRAALGLRRFHLYGHSFGGALALQYALTQPEGLASLIVADSFASADGWLARALELRRDLPPEVRELLERHEANGTTRDPAYQQAFGEDYFAVHVCRVAVPESLERTFARSGAEVYRVMYGPQWFQMTGKYQGWTVVDRLPEIRVPTLVLAGRYDQCIPALSEQIHRNIAGSELVIFGESSHVPFTEEPGAHDRAVLDFLGRVEAQERRSGQDLPQS